jgi:hypothetical protein
MDELIIEVSFFHYKSFLQVYDAKSPLHTVLWIKTSLQFPELVETSMDLVNLVDDQRWKGKSTTLIEEIEKV